MHKSIRICGARGAHDARGLEVQGLDLGHDAERGVVIQIAGRFVGQQYRRAVR